MPRSPAEATRFTSTGPHAYSKSTASTINISAPPPPNETPAQKVARLREASRRAKLGQESTWDKIVLRGRVWADRAHRLTTTALIGSSVVAAGFAGLSIMDMIYHNKAKKAEWFAEQEANYQKALALARKAEAEGKLTDDLRMFLNKQRALEAYEAEKEMKVGLLTRAKQAVIGDLNVEEKAGGNLGLVATEKQRAETIRADRVRELLPEGVVDAYEPAEAKAADEIRRKLSSINAATLAGASIRGGYFDRLGEQAASSIDSSSRGWINWVTGR